MANIGTKRRHHPRLAAVFLVLFILLQTLTAAAAATISLQSPHEVLTPSQRFKVLSDIAENEGITAWDVYGDYDKITSDRGESSSFLRTFETQVASEFGKEDAVFMPSGVMAQSAALLIHQKQHKRNGSSFGCHSTSHLLLHEQAGYKELCGLDAVILNRKTAKVGFDVPPLLYEHVVDNDNFKEDGDDNISTIILELPHRELGGKLTPWEDIEQMSQHLKSAGIAFHCDGARIFEAIAGYDEKVSNMADLVRPFDSVYISFYKGLGGLSGAMLIGTTDFCNEARIWCRRFGGNLYTLMPYIVPAWSGYQNNYYKLLEKSKSNNHLSFREKKGKLVRLADAFAADDCIPKVITLEPAIPQVNMVHVYLRPSLKVCKQVCKDIEDRTDVCLFQRIRPLDENDPGYSQGYCCKLEISIGEANGHVPDDVWVTAWSEFCRESLKQMEFD